MFVSEGLLHVNTSASAYCKRKIKELGAISAVFPFILLVMCVTPVDMNSFSHNLNGVRITSPLRLVYL